MARRGYVQPERRSPPFLPQPEWDVYLAIQDLSAELGYAPTLAQIAERLSWSPKSKGSVHRYVDKLRARGVVEGRGRRMRVVR